jgi:hypothetical protein
MQPTNNKALLHFIFDQMEKLDSGDIDVQQAKAQADLAKQANNMMKYELDRTNTLIKLDQHNRQTGGNIELRNIEGKSF